MKMLALITDAFGSHGGIALYNRDLLRALCVHSNSAQIVALPRLMNRPPEPMPSNLNYVTDGLRGKLSYTMALLKLLGRERKFRLILCAHINLLPLAYVAHLVTRAPIVLVIYGTDAWEMPRGRFWNFLLRRVFTYVSISKVTQDRFLEWAKLHETTGYILPNAIHLELYAPGKKDPELLTRYGLAGKSVLATLGRIESLERSKGFDEVMEVLPDLVNEIPNVAYLIVGDGSDLERLKEKAKALGVEERVIFTGLVPEDTKPAHYRLADAYVMPSRWEGFGFVILEALATGIPTIASKADGTREAVRDGMLGSLVDPGDANEIKRAIVNALKKPKKIPEGLEYFSYQNFERRLHGMMDEWLVRSSSR